MALSVGVLFSSSLPSYAQGTEEGIENTLNKGTIDLNHLDKRGSKVSIKQLSYDEAMASIAEYEGRTIEETKIKYPKNVSNGFTASSDTWITEISIPQEVNWAYVPTLKIFAYLYSSGSFRQFQKLVTVQLDRESSVTGASKQFAGELKAEITSNDPTKIWWLVNGDFYDNGTTSISGGVQADGKIWKGNLSVQYATNHYKYWYNQSTYSLY
ncbi:hypothetical protein D3C72_426570 [compost metagenome]